MRDPRNPKDEHLDFMDFCQTLDIDNFRPFLGEEKYSIDENGIYANTLIPVEKPY